MIRRERHNNSMQRTALRAAADAERSRDAGASRERVGADFVYRLVRVAQARREQAARPDNGLAFRAQARYRSAKRRSAPTR